MRQQLGADGGDGEGCRDGEEESGVEVGGVWGQLRSQNSSQQLPGGVGGPHGYVPGEPAIPNRPCILPKNMSAPLLSYSPNQDLMEAKTESPSDNDIF